MSLVPTKKISQLTDYGAPLNGAELLEIWVVNTSRRVTARQFVLPSDSLVTIAGQGGSIPGSRQLVSSPTIQVVDGGAGGQVQLVATTGTGGSTVVQSVNLVAGNNDNLVLGPAPSFTGFLECSTPAGNSDLTGMVAQFDGQVVVISNLGPNPLRLMSLAVTASAANQFRLSSNIGIVPNGSYTLRYSNTIGKWVAY